MALCRCGMLQWAGGDGVRHEDSLHLQGPSIPVTPYDVGFQKALVAALCKLRRLQMSNH